MTGFTHHASLNPRKHKCRLSRKYNSSQSIFFLLRKEISLFLSILEYTNNLDAEWLILRFSWSFKRKMGIFNLALIFENSFLFYSLHASKNTVASEIMNNILVRISASQLSTHMKSLKFLFQVMNCPSPHTHINVLMLHYLYYYSVIKQQKIGDIKKLQTRLHLRI